jgi:hypothetical protein
MRIHIKLVIAGKEEDPAVYSLGGGDDLTKVVLKTAGLLATL